MDPRRPRSRSLPLLALALWGLAPGGAARADLTTTYVVDVDTTGLQNTSGYLDFQFNPNDATARPATAEATHFRTDATGISAYYNAGDASGTLTTSLAFDNGQATNEWTYQLTFGTSASFDVTLSQSGVGGSGSAFYLTLLDGSGDSYSTGPATVAITVNPDGSTMGTAYSPVDGVSPTATVTLQSVPEPSTSILAALGIATHLGWYWARRRPAD